MIRWNQKNATTDTADQRTFICDVSGEQIAEEREVRLLRPVGAPPEDPTLYHVHETHVETFLKQHPGRWEQHRIPSLVASSLLPMKISASERAKQERAATPPASRRGAKDSRTGVSPS